MDKRRAVEWNASHIFPGFRVSENSGSRTRHLVDCFARNWTVIYCAACAIKRFRTCNYLADLPRAPFPQLLRLERSSSSYRSSLTKINVLSFLLKLIIWDYYDRWKRSFAFNGSGRRKKLDLVVGGYLLLIPHRILYSCLLFLPANKKRNSDKYTHDIFYKKKKKEKQHSERSKKWQTKVSLK